MNLKLNKYSRWKSSGWLVYDLGRLELTVIAGQFGHLCREAYRKIKASKHGSKQLSKQVCKLVEVTKLLCSVICNGSLKSSI